MAFLFARTLRLPLKRVGSQSFGLSYFTTTTTTTTTMTTATTSSSTTPSPAAGPLRLSNFSGDTRNSEHLFRSAQASTGASDAQNKLPGSNTPFSDLNSELSHIASKLGVLDEFDERKKKFLTIFKKHGTVLNGFTITDMIASRMHFGHHQSQLEQEAKNYVYGVRDQIHIIDLEKSYVLLRRAMNVARHIAYKGGIILFISNRPEHVVAVRQAAHYSGEYFISEEWKSGTFTNNVALSGRSLLPDLVIFTSIPATKVAVHEATICSLPSIGLIDTDVHPGLVHYPIPGNDDSPESVNFVLSQLSLAIYEGKYLRENKLPLH